MGDLSKSITIVGNCSVPQAELIINNSVLSFNVSDNSEKIIIKVSEQCQGVPINQTFSIISGPVEETNFISFDKYGMCEINLKNVSEVGEYTVIIQNQEMLINMSANNTNPLNYILDDPLSFKITFFNYPPKLISNLNMSDGYVDQKYLITLNFTDAENDRVFIKFQSDFSTISDTYLSSQVENNFTVEWTPSIFDIGVNNITLIYWDNFHQISKIQVDFTVVVINFTNPYFDPKLNDLEIFAGQNYEISIPAIINPSNANISLSIKIEDSNQNIVNISEWFTWNDTTFTIFPKCELLGSNVATAILSSYSSNSFNLKVSLNQNNKICNQEDVKFIAGVSQCFDFSNRLLIDFIVSIELNILVNKKYFDIHFNYLQSKYMLSVFNTSNGDLENVKTRLRVIDSNSIIYQTNYFMLMVAQNYPPTVVNRIDNLTFYKGNLNNSIFMNEDLFRDDDKITLNFNECTTTNSLVVSFSIQEFKLDKLSLIKIFFVNNFVGMCTYEIVATDLLNQSAVLEIHIQVVPCAQTDCIRCIGSYQKDCLICADGYQLMEDGSCLFIDSTNVFKNRKYLFIKLIIILSVILSLVISFLNFPYELCTLVVYLNQIMMISCLISSSVSSDMIHFLSILQIIKMDLKFLDILFHARDKINSQFYKIQLFQMRYINFESGSTFANFINYFIMSAVFGIIFLAGVLVIKWEKKNEINVLSKFFKNYINLKVYASSLRLCFIFMCVNCFSELLNQITLRNNQGDILSYSISDSLLFILICILLFTHMFNPAKSIFNSVSIINNDRANLLKLAIYAVIFTFNDISKLLKFCIAVLEILYLLYIIFCCEFIGVIERIVIILLHSLICLLNIFPLLNFSNSDFIKMAIVTTVNILILILILYNIAIAIVIRFFNLTHKNQNIEAKLSNYIIIDIYYVHAILT